MKRWLLLPLVLVLATCTQPTTDPDAAVRALILATPWDQNTATYPTEQQARLVFNVNGTYYSKGSTVTGWTLKNGVFTFTDPNGTYTTTNPAISSTSFAFNMSGGLVHFIPAP